MLLELLALEHSIAGDALSEIIFSEVVGAAVHRSVSAFLLIKFVLNS